MGSWCILRCSGKNTIPLAQSLVKAGYDAWTPIEKLRKRTGQSREEISAPLTPTFVFAGADRLLDLINLADSLRKSQPDFSVFHYLGSIPILHDDALNGLRHAEARKVPRRRQRTYAAGETVMTREGPFSGLPGVVEDGNGRYTLVCFGKLRARIATFLLHPEKKDMAA